MSMHKVTTDLKAAMDAVAKIEDGLREAKKKLEAFEKNISDMAKKPMMYFKNTRNSVEIVKYHKYSDDYVEFETKLARYRYIKLGKSKEYVLPKTGLYCTLESSIGHIFESYDSTTHRYFERDDIGRIELLEGVDEYDET